MTPRVRTNLRVPMQDGTMLATDTYLPPGPRPVPVLLLRTPYGKDTHRAEGLGWARRGFGLVVQDVRGRYDSGGVWEPYANERLDGAITVNWVANQPWCAGSVVVMGGSYASFTAWTVALSGHPAICAVISLVPAVGVHTCYGPGGVLYLASHVRWWLANGDGAIRRDGLFEAMYRAQPEVFAHLPVSELGDILWADVPTWFDPAKAGPGAVPAYAVTDAELAALALPALHVGGWYDGFLERSLQQWRVAGSAVRPRPARSLLIGPWTHELRTDQLVRHGERRHGPAARVALGRVLVEWLSAVLDGSARDSTAQVYVCGAEQWHTAADWPGATRTDTWYAAAGGTLRPDPPSGGGQDIFCYDPADPFPSRSVPADRTDLDRRSDATRYLTPELAHPCELAGTPEVELHASTDAPATDWVARLLEVTPAGSRRHLSQGVLDTAQVSGRPLGEQPHAYRIRLTPLAVRLPAGHRFCLEITSSDFPDHARNLNTGADRLTTIEMRTATQQVHYGPDTPTALLLPVRPGS
ncbi:MAG TPA: CocE/NonD family hydrolase [Pseudonocardiaceae bacterium]|nr:CocE/NonD family hydrolase [Pseudonocardiaceae bacterium]